MRPIADFAAKFGGKQVLIAPRTSLDGYGKASYGSDVAYNVHIAQKQELVRNQNGQEVTSLQQVWVLSGDLIPTTSRLTFSTGDVGSTEAAQITPKILAVVRRYDGPNAHHSVIYL